jgi:xanthine dehydrogenase YagS FAD-binding subunit
MDGFDYLVAERLDAALAEYAGGEAALKAGGIDLLDLMKERIESPQTVLSIDRLDDLRYIREEQDGVHIGALTTLAELGRSDLLRERYTALHKSASTTATPQVRQRATVAGNLCQRPRCWYYRHIEFNCLKNGGGTCFAVEGENQYHAIFGGGPCHIVHPSNVAPALVALDAALVVRRGEEEAERIRAEKFFVLPRQSMYAENVLRQGQIITEIVLPSAPARSATVELREKQSFDWPIASASVAEMDGAWRVVLGAVAPIPWLSRPAMQVLGNNDLTAELAARAGEAAVEEAEPMSDNAYKIQLVKVVTRRALMSAAGMEVNGVTNDE